MIKKYIKCFWGLTILTLMMMILVAGTVLGAPPTNPLEFNEGYTITLDDFDYHIKDKNLTLHSGVYDSLTGIKVNDSICSVQILFMPGINEIEVVYTDFDFDYEADITTLNASLFNNTGKYKAEFWCHDAALTKGGFTSVSFDTVTDTKFGLWTPVTNWTFPIVYLILTFIVIGVGLYYSSSIIGIFGSIMLVLAYFLVGATAPLLFVPLLIIGLLMGFKFATI